MKLCRIRVILSQAKNLSQERRSTCDEEHLMSVGMFYFRACAGYSNRAKNCAKCG